jgi:hypothetical protein
MLDQMFCWMTFPAAWEFETGVHSLVLTTLAVEVGV